MPTPKTWNEWLLADERLSIACAKARLDGFDAIAAETLRIADDGSNDYMERLSKDGESTGAAFNAEHVQRSKLRVETRLKLLAKWDPKRYGDRMEIKQTTDIPADLAAAVAAMQRGDIDAQLIRFAADRAKKSAKE